MSEYPPSPQDSAAPPAGPVGGRPPEVRLPGWVNVVLVLILLASCGATDRGFGSHADTSQIADDVVQQLQDDASTDTPGAIATREDVRQLCRLLARMAAKQGVDAGAVNEAEAPSACQDGVADAAP
jgi:hypothetical protein